ncbi:ribosomal RNA-processing protein 9 [Dioscorea alata]|uniref:Ribosomal RNA-processing protein 9 n=1 Tax=Dioscorea alata TaxID=55571 RepID=A0ACB7W1F0_DIOAL|nr:ribosomal RNA-processing protein 9 [Dioscorea alata]
MKHRSKKPYRSRNPRAALDNDDDPFFESDPKRRRRGGDEEIEDVSSDEDVGLDDREVGEEEKEEAPEETADEVRYRIAKEYLQKVRALTQREEEEDEDEGNEEEGREDKDGRRDSLVAEKLLKDQLQDSGRIRRLIASRVQKPEDPEQFRYIVKHRQSVTAVALTVDEVRGFSASKDGTIMQWDVESGKSEKYMWPSEEVLISHHAKPHRNPSLKRSKQVLALAVSTDGRYLVTGGLDRHVHLWDTRAREHIQAFPGHLAPVSCLVFQPGTSQLFSGSFDRTMKLWDVEDRSHINNLFGHQSEVLTVDCLGKLDDERLLTVGRDRTLRMWKVHDESQLVFRGPAASLECCCFIDGNEFISGSDDGSIELWSSRHKKPIHIIKNAHALPYQSNRDEKEVIPDGCIKENGIPKEKKCSLAESWVSSIAVCKGSDLAVSGAANGLIRLWAIENDNKGLRPLFDYPLDGFINSLAFAKSGRFFVAGVGQEPRLGRWGRVPTARNGVAIHPIRLAEERGLRS